MQCPQCQYENREGRRFCSECGTPLSLSCDACTFVNEPNEKFCGGCGIPLAGQPSAPSPAQTGQRPPDAERHFQVLLPAVIALLQQESRVTYRTLKYIFGLDDALLNDIRKELGLKRLATDEDDEVLIWTGEIQPTVQPAVVTPSQPVTAPPTPPLKAETPTRSDGPTLPADAFTPEPTRAAPEAERRQLTVMFCDLANSTKLSQELDPEDLREVIRSYQQTSAEVIQRFDGHIAQHLGDGLLIYFGWPRAHEDDAQRSLHAGLGIIEAVTTNLNPRLEAEKGVQLTVRLGVHTGPVVVGEMGSGGRRENLATGETVNIAARLEGLASPNTVMISNVTARLVRGAFALEDLGPHELKGVAEPMQVFRVLEPAEGHRDEDERMPDGGVFLVGRDEEVGLLLRRWEQSKDGLGQVVLISGEAGIGKSSLVATVRGHVMEEGYTCITFRCSPYHTNSAFYPVITHLEQILGFDRDNAPDTRLNKLEQALKTTRLPLEESVPPLATLLSVPIDDRYPALTLSPQQQRQLTLDTLVAWLIEESEKRAVLAVWEDLHWADPSTLEMLGVVLEQTPTVPRLNVLTFRPEFESPWPTRSHMMPITLNRLERPQVEALITHMTGDKILPAEVVGHIVTKTDGVPLYVEELTKMLLESDLLREEAEQYVLTGPLLSVAIPDTLQDSLMARLDQMRTAKEVAQFGAVLGREFDYDIFQAISSQDEETLQSGLAQLVEAELLYQRGRPPRARYIFKHALVQDAAYASLLRSTRQQVHQQIAQVLETQYTGTVETQPELVAHHYTESDCHQKAAMYWHRAGECASGSSAYVEAVAHFQKGLDVLQPLPETDERAELELPLQLGLGTSLIVSQGWTAPAVEHAYVRAYKLCQQLGEPPVLIRVLQELRRLYALRGDRGATQKARELGEQLLALAQRQNDSVLLQEAHWALGQTLYYLGELNATRRHLEQSSAFYTPQPLTSQTSRDQAGTQIACLFYTDLVLWMLGYPDQALRVSHDALSLAHELSHPFTLTFAFAEMAMIHQLRREVQAMRQQTEAMMALANEQGFAVYTRYGTIFRAWTLTMEDEQQEAITQIRQAMATLRAGIDDWALYYARLAEAYGAVGKTEEGLRSVAEALELIEKTGFRVYEPELHRVQGELLLQQSGSDASQVEACFHRALDVARRQHAKSWELRAATSLARLWQSQAKRHEAVDLLTPVYGWFTEGFDTVDLKDAKALLDALGASP
jgi:class 3 adenylate cyclase/predicted ATPase